MKNKLNPKTAIISQSSNLNLNDSLEAETLEIFTENQIKLETHSNFSNVHGIQGNDVRTFTYAIIIAPFRFVLQKALAAPKA